jgi:hypothetical protein
VLILSVLVVSEPVCGFHPLFLSSNRSPYQTFFTRQNDSFNLALSRLRSHAVLYRIYFVRGVLHRYQRRKKMAAAFIDGSV